MHEIPRGIVIVDIPFTVENELLTPTGKLCRRKLVKKFQKEIDAVVSTIDLSVKDPLKSLKIDPSVIPKSMLQLVNEVLNRDPSQPLTQGNID